MVKPRAFRGPAESSTPRLDGFEARGPEQGRDSALRKGERLEEFWKSEEAAVYQGNSLKVLKTLSPSSAHALVTDPPAGVAFMGKDWDKDKGGRQAWIDWLSAILAEARRVLKPGAHALVWSLPRTSHWTGTALEDAGFEIRDTIDHVFATGFPKNHDIAKAINKAAGVEPIGVKPPSLGMANDPQWNTLKRQLIMPEPQTEAAKAWGG